MTIETYNTISVILAIVSALCVAAQVVLMKVDANSRQKELAHEKELAAQQEAERVKEWEQRKKEYDVPLDISAITRAVDLAEYYRKEIIPALNFINVSFVVLDIDALIKDLPFDKMREFNAKELNEEIFTDGLGEAHKRMVSTADSKIVSLCKYYCYRDLASLKEESIVSKAVEGHDDKIARLLKKSQLTDAITEVLNKMEYFAMNLYSGIADESVVYQSLHQTFLSHVHALYYWISYRNVSNSCKFYTNIIWLHEQWSKQRASNDAQEKENDKTIEFKKRAVESQSDKTVGLRPPKRVNR